MNRSAFTFLFAGLLHGCSTVNSDATQDKPIWRVGVVKIDSKSEAGSVKKSDIVTLGFWFGDSGVGAGYNKSEKLSLDGSCRLVVIVKNSEQLENLKIFFHNNKELNGDELCLEIE